LTARRFVDHVAADFDLPGFVVERDLHKLAGGGGQFVARASGLGLNLSEWSTFGGSRKTRTRRDNSDFPQCTVDVQRDDPEGLPHETPHLGPEYFWGEVDIGETENGN
jgi:hypothetical protein